MSTGRRPAVGPRRRRLKRRLQPGVAFFWLPTLSTQSQRTEYRGNHVSSTIMSRLYFLHYQKKDLFAGNVVNNLILRNNLILLIRKLDILNPSFEKGKAARRPPVLKTGRRAPAHNGTAACRWFCRDDRRPTDMIAVGGTSEARTSCRPPRRIVIGGRPVAELVLRPLASGQRPPAGTFLELFPHKKDTFALPKYFNSNNSKFQQKFSNG